MPSRRSESACPKSPPTAPASRRTAHSHKPPPLIPSVFAALLCSTLSILCVASDLFAAFPQAVHFLLYACAALALALAAWSLIVFLKRNRPKQLFLRMAQGSPFSAKLVGDYSYRTMFFASCSLLFHSVLTVCKMITGWYYASSWLMVLSEYYAVLIVAKFILIGYSKQQRRMTDRAAKIRHEWKAYRLCGVMLLVLTASLQGVVILIVRDGQGFFYQDEIVVIAVAAYDFYCLGSAGFYLISQRKKHTPIVTAIKWISFASSLVAMLSLQTAMFASFGENDAQWNLRRNAATGTVVCACLVVLGITILVKSNRELNAMQEEHT